MDDLSGRAHAQDIEQRREQCWRTFCDAADASADGKHDLAFAYVKAHPEGAGELRAFVRALKAGRIVKVEPYRYKRPPRKAYQ